MLDSLPCAEAERRGARAKPMDRRAIYSGKVVTENGFPTCAGG